MPPGTFAVDPPGTLSEPRSHDRPAVIMVLAPLLGAAIWGAILYLLVG